MSGNARIAAVEVRSVIRQFSPEDDIVSEFANDRFVVCTCRTRHHPRLTRGKLKWLVIQRVEIVRSCPDRSRARVDWLILRTLDDIASRRIKIMAQGGIEQF